MTIIEQLKEEVTKQSVTNQPEEMVGLQIMDIVAGDPDAAGIVMTDLQNGMSLSKCATEIKKLADEKHKQTKGSCVIVTPKEAEAVIRKYFGLQEVSSKPEKKPETPAGGEIIDLADFL